MQFISDDIGNDYMNWGSGDTIFLASPTGTGKTTFILNTLLPFYAEQKKSILYLVNRKVLKKQLMKEISNLPADFQSAIEVKLYQDMENAILECCRSNNSPDKNLFDAVNSHLVYQYGYYNCVVCDEAHYFIMDSNYNTNTILSYKAIEYIFCWKTRIYISATIEPVKEYIIKDTKNLIYYQTKWFKYHTQLYDGLSQLRLHKPLEYRAKKDYSYIDIKIISQRELIPEIVVTANKKWLIFVDDKEYGKILAKDIESEYKKQKIDIKKTDIIFVTSDYDQDIEGSGVVNDLIDSKKQAAKILIATSVLDNGISIKDRDLRNILIYTDTEAEFIQMLGRKRKDNQQIKLFIPPYKKEHFTKRLNMNNKRKKVADEYFVAIHKKLNEFKNTYYGDLNSLMDYLYLYENKLIYEEHINLSNKLSNGLSDFADIKASFLSVNGKWYLNLLSLQHLEELSSYYQKIISDYDEYGDSAFLRHQLSWLGKLDDEITEIVNEASLDRFEKSRNKIIDKFESKVDKIFTRDEFIEFRKEIETDDLKNMVESVAKDFPKYTTYMNTASRKDRTLSKEFVDFLRENCDIPYVLVVKKDIYVLKRPE